MERLKTNKETGRGGSETWSIQPPLGPIQWATEGTTWPRFSRLPGTQVGEETQLGASFSSTVTDGLLRFSFVKHVQVGGSWSALIQVTNVVLLIPLKEKSHAPV